MLPIFWWAICSSFIYASRTFEGSLENVIDDLASDGVMDDSCDQKTILLKAARNGDVVVLGNVVATADTAHVKKALRIGVKYNRPQVVQEILEHYIDLAADNHSILHLAIEYDHAEVLQLLIKNSSMSDSEYISLFRKACRIGSLRCLHLMLEHPVLDFSVSASNMFLIVASFSPAGLECRVEPNNVALAVREAAEQGREAVLRLLMKDGRFDESFAEAINHALSAGRLQILRLLFAHPSVSTFWMDQHPQIMDNALIIKACKMNELSCICKDSTTLALDDLDILCRCALAHGHMQTFDILLRESAKRTPTAAELARWLETMDYLVALLIRHRDIDRIYVVLNIIKPSWSLSIDEQEAEIRAMLGWVQANCLDHVTTLLNEMLRHLALVKTLSNYCPKDLWSEIFQYQLINALFTEHGL